ncbi:MAG: ATP synthase F1 subunit delta [Caedibacter sp. 38-128]|nr:ATP synthase F1 subunit delta [Holosporales bacterium]OJX03578.1 MAG: ATP synthase F1 subunit delta [Caedibacter sp. 38-128]
MNQVSKRYAEALFKSAENNKKVEQVRQELHILKNLCDQHGVLKRMLHNPLLNKKEVAVALLEFSKTCKFSTLLSNLLQMLALQKRLPLLQNIITSFEEIIDQSQGILNAHVTSAHTLSEKQKKSLTDLLEQKLSSKINLREQVNADLLGGYIIQIGPYLFDNTLSYKLSKLSQSLKRVV